MIVYVSPYARLAHALRSRCQNCALAIESASVFVDWFDVAHRRAVGLVDAEVARASLCSSKEDHEPYARLMALAAACRAYSCNLALDADIVHSAACVLVGLAKTEEELAHALWLFSEEHVAWMKRNPTMVRIGKRRAPRRRSSTVTPYRGDNIRKRR